MPELVSADLPRAGFRRHHAVNAFRAEDSILPRPTWRLRQPGLPRRVRSLDQPAPTRPAGNHVPHSVGWLASLLFHATLLVLGTALLVRSAHLDVIPGKTSTEMILMAPPAASVVPRPPPIHAITSPPPAARAQPVLPPVATPKPQPVRPVAPISAMTAPVAKLRPPAPVSRAAADSPARGAVEARPDEPNNQPPVYPEDSRAEREQGVVMLCVAVSATGEASQVAILKSSGYFRLDQAARTAVRAWRFHPALLGDLPIGSKVDVPVRFELQ